MCQGINFQSRRSKLFVLGFSRWFAFLDSQYSAAEAESISGCGGMTGSRCTDTRQTPTVQTAKSALLDVQPRACLQIYPSVPRSIYEDGCSEACTSATAQRVRRGIEAY
ncbi:MAG: hypothetical protein DMG61_21710 [Acidobacteria bacterium]|nr:MAG: hypothetical protein DMG61_21710 [Acidobacteriota bacterium]